jgi:predicted PurR-regulated permease PerM
MKYISSLLSRLRPMQMLISFALSAVLIFTSSTSALAAAKSDVQKGVDQLPQIEEKSLETLDNPPMSLEQVEERSKGSLNEAQPGAADRDKMYRSNDPIPPVVKQAERTLDKMKKS